MRNKNDFNNGNENGMETKELPYYFHSSVYIKVKLNWLRNQSIYKRKNYLIKNIISNKIIL